MSRLALLALVLTAGPAGAQERREPLVEKVHKSIAGGVRYLRNQQRANGGWETETTLNAYEGGPTSLTILALLNAGVPKSDPAITRGLRNLRALTPPKIYVRALQTMALVEAGFPEDRELIQRNVQFLLDARVIRDGRLMGWTYDKTSNSNLTDNSNTQYALLGLWAGRQAGIAIPREVWVSVREMYERLQREAGFWVYSDDFGPAGHDGPSLTMTSAGLCGLLIASQELNGGREKFLPNGQVEGCGTYTETPAIAKALRWLGKNFTIDGKDRTFYHLYGVERVGRLSGLRFLGEHDWYREGCDYLTGRQHPDGSWSTTGTYDRYPVLSTSFALLFLSKGRTPVLISKLVHGEWNPQLPGGRNEADTDWNNDRNDLRHFVPFAAKELYKDVPLAWQNFDLMRAATSQPGGAANEDQQAEITAELLQAPIAYITGHRSPLLRFTPLECQLLKRYVENGGFILAEACCNSPEFDRGFKALVAKIWGDDYELTELDGTHPVWTSFAAVPPGKPYKLMGLSMGCKTVLIYSPQDLSCQWESGPPNNGPSQMAFRLGTNIVAYATGREPPRPRLTPVTVASNKTETPPTKHGYFKVGQLYHGGDWRPAPNAMRNLMEYANQNFGLDVKLKTERLLINDRSLIDYKFLYMHGRGAFSYPADQLDHLRFNLENGGLLLADACCGKEPFDQSFRKFVKELFPTKALERVPLDDRLFAADPTGTALTSATIRYRSKINGPLQSADPYLEGIKVNNRWALLYSRYDLGCALERHQSSDCLGYDPDSALRIAGAAVLYNLRP